MKSRKKIASEEKTAVTREKVPGGHLTLGSGDADREKRSKKRNRAKDSREKLEFIHQHTKQFSRNLGYNGNPDAYFKKILRNYDPSFNLQLNTSRSSSSRIHSRSLPSLKAKVPEKTGAKSVTVVGGEKKKKKQPRKKRSRLTTPNSQQLVVNLREVQETVKSTPKPKEAPEDFDQDIFYSPSSHTFKSPLSSPPSSFAEVAEVSETLKTDRSNHNFKSLLSSSHAFFDELAEVEDAGQTAPATMDEEDENADLNYNLEGEYGEEGAITDGETTAATTDLETTDGEEMTDDEMEEVQELIRQASQQMSEVVDAVEAEKMFDLGAIDEVEEGEDQPPDGALATSEQADDQQGSHFKFDPAVDSDILRELEEAENQAKETAKVIYQLKIRVTELLKKETQTEAEAKELEAKNKELMAAMLLFEEKTKRIQFLLGQTNLFESMMSPGSPLQTKRPEDALPKVIICGLTENNMPKLIVCDEKKARRRSSSPKREMGDGKGQNEDTCPALCMRRQSKQQDRNVNFPMVCGQEKDMSIPMSVVPKFAKRLNDSYCMQEKLVTENSDLEGARYQLQNDLLVKDQAIEFLQRKLCTIQYEMKMICKENCSLNEKVQNISCTAAQAPQTNATCHKKKQPCGPGKGPCPADVEGRLNEYSETTKYLEKQLVDMENDVKAMQGELTAVQKEREHLDQHRKIIVCPIPPCMSPYSPCASPCMPCPPCPPGPPCLAGPPCTPCPPCPPGPPCLAGPPCSPCPPCPGMSPCSPCPPCPGMAPCSPQPCPATVGQLQLLEMREQYEQLQDDFKGKVTEVAGLRTDNEKLKSTVKEAEESRKWADDKLKEFERAMRDLKIEKNKFLGSKEQLIEQEQQLAVAKQRFREAQDELEELRSMIQDQQGQVDDYRNKYLEAQQLVEEQKRHLDIMEMDTNRINEQVNMEIQRVKSQFQEKLEELMPLPDLLKSTQIKLQEAQQMHLLAERNNEAINLELQMYKEKVAQITNELEQIQADQMMGKDNAVGLGSQLDELKRKCELLEEDNYQLKRDLEAMEQVSDENERRAEQKMHEIAQLSAQLEIVREESARQVARNKERCETVRRSMQNQIYDLERQLAQSRAQAKAAQKDRDEIRQKMQAQISNLHENFEDAQMRIRNLQGHVNFLKDSYNVVPPFDDNTGGDDACNCGTNY